MAARQPLGTIHTLAVIQIVVTVIGADLRVCKCDAHFQSRMLGGISLQYRLGIDDARHTQYLRGRLCFRRTNNPDGRDVQLFANTL